MKKLFILFFLLCLSATAFAGSLQRSHIAVISAGTVSSADITAPEFSSATIAADGDTVTVVFTEAVTDGGLDGAEFDLDCDGAGGADNALIYSSGDTTDTWVFTTTTTVETDETCNIDFDGDADEVQDASGNDLADFSDQSVTNNSEQGGASYEYDLRFNADVGTPTGFTVDSGSPDFFNESSPLEGAGDVLLSDGTGTEQAFQVQLAGASEYYIAFKYQQVNNGCYPMYIRNSSDQTMGRIRDYSNTIRFYPLTGSYASLALSGTQYIKLRLKYVDGAGSDEVELWITDNTTSWGSSSVQTGGTITTGPTIDNLLFTNVCAAAIHIDQLVIDPSDIPITAMQ